MRPDPDPSVDLTFDRSDQLRAAIDASGYYPDIVAEAAMAAAGGEPVVAFLVHHEPTIDERDEVHRHETVLLLTPTRLILCHTDERPPDELLPQPYTSTSTEAVPLSRLTSVVVNRMVPTPAKFVSGASTAAEALLTIGWGAVGRIDLEPATCGDPTCDADHGYTGMVTSDDFSLRVSEAAEGAGAVAQLLEFADALSAHGTRSTPQA